MTLDTADDYYWSMAARRRLLSITGSEGTKLLCTFFVLRGRQELSRFYCRPPWSVPVDAPDGPLIFIDKLVGKGFTRACVRKIEELMAQYVPGFTEAIWYRPTSGRDKRYTYRRRLHASQHHSD